MLWFSAITRINLTKVAVATNLAPVITVLTGHFFLREQISAWIILSAILIVSGIYLSNRARGRVPLRGPSTPRPAGA